MVHCLVVGCSNTYKNAFYKLPEDENNRKGGSPRQNERANAPNTPGNDRSPGTVLIISII